MTDRMTLVQARVSVGDAHQLDIDARALGLANRSEAIREGLRLLHSRARDVALAQDYDTFYGDTFYGAGARAPVSDVAAIGDQLAVEVLSNHSLGN